MWDAVVVEAVLRSFVSNVSPVSVLIATVVVVVPVAVTFILVDVDDNVVLFAAAVVATFDVVVADDDDDDDVLHLSCLHGVESTSILTLSSNKNGNTSEYKIKRS